VNINNNKFNTLAAIFITLFVIAFIITLFPKAYLWLFAPDFQEDSALTSFMIQTKSLAFIYSIFSLAIQIGCAGWLFVESKKSRSQSWVWSALGLFAGVFAVILWYLKGIYEHLSVEKPSQPNALAKLCESC